MEDTWYSLAAMPGWLYVDTGASGGKAATILQVDILSRYRLYMKISILQVEESKGFVPIGRWNKGVGIEFFNTSDTAADTRRWNYQ